MDSFSDCGIVLRHSLAYADDLWRMCVVNRMSVYRAAERLGLPKPQCKGAVRLLKQFGRVPSRERLASIVMRDWGLDDFDIAEIFGRSVRWAGAVRAHVQELREAEPVPEQYEFLDDGLHPDDPCPEEVYRRAAEIRAARRTKPKDMDRQVRPQLGMRCFMWDGRNASYLSVSAAQWAGR